jgi:heme-degrading monooxygenase HmoA
MHPTDHIQIVTFQLAGLDSEAYRAHAEAMAPAFAEIPGLRAKAWLANPSTNTYGGVYAWESREAMEAYLSGPIFADLLANQGLADVASRDFELLERPTEITRDRVTGAAGPLVGADRTV